MLRSTHAWSTLSGLLMAFALVNNSPAVEETSDLQKCELGSIKQVHQFGNIYLAGQPSEEDLPKLQADGMKTVINLRTPGEVPWDEGVAVKKAGMNYIYAPFRGAEQLTPKVFDKVLSVLNDKESGPTLLHCGSANRVGALWYAHRVLNDGINPVDAELEAKTVGLRDAAYLTKAKEYITAQQSKKAKAPAANE